MWYGISFALDEICGMETLRNVQLLAQDISDTISAKRKENSVCLVAVISSMLFGIIHQCSLYKEVIVKFISPAVSQ